MSSSLEAWVLGVESTRLSQLLMVPLEPDNPPSNICASSQNEEMELELPTYKGLSCFVQDGNYLEPLKFLQGGTGSGLCRGIHVERCKGNPTQNRAYCSKEDTRDSEAPFGFEEFGTIPAGGGTRTDLQSVCALIKEGKREREIFEEAGETYIRNCRGIQRALSLMDAPRSFKTVVHWYHGPTGSGKSRAAQEESLDAYWKSSSNSWWDGYSGQDTTIIDDYRIDFCKFNTLLNLMDRYPMKVEYKGGVCEFRSKKLIITSPFDPARAWHNQCAEDIEQLLRRIDVVEAFPRAPEVIEDPVDENL